MLRHSILSFFMTLRLLGVVALSFAVPSPPSHSDHAVHETRAAEWARTGSHLYSNRVLPKCFGLFQQNLHWHRLEEMLMSGSCSHPAGSHLNHHQKG